jgi:hypothetical protein
MVRLNSEPGEEKVVKFVWLWATGTVAVLEPRVRVPVVFSFRKFPIVTFRFELAFRVYSQSVEKRIRRS